MKPELIKSWKDIKIYLIKSEDTDEAGDFLMKKFVTNDSKSIGYNKFGKPYLRSKKINFNLTHTNGYAAIAISKKYKIGLDIERLDRKTDFRSFIMSRFNFQLYTQLNSQKEFIKQWTIRESAIKCHGDLTLNSIYKIKTNDDDNVLKCEGKEDLEYHVFFHNNVCVCVSKNI